MTPYILVSSILAHQSQSVRYVPRLLIIRSCTFVDSRQLQFFCNGVGGKKSPSDLLSGDYAFCEKAQWGDIIFQVSFLLMLLQNLSQSIVKTESQAINSTSAEYWPNVHDHCIDPKGIGLRVCILACVG